MPADAKPPPPPDANWMDCRDNAQRSDFHRHPSKRERERESLMRAWFGPHLATGEIGTHQQGPQPIGSTVDMVLAKISSLGPEPLLVAIRTEWPKIVGPDAAKRSHPAVIQGSRLLIEVSDSTWLYALDRMHKPIILGKLRTFTHDAVQEIRFQAGGSRPAVPNGRAAMSRRTG